MHPDPILVFPWYLHLSSPLSFSSLVSYWNMIQGNHSCSVSNALRLLTVKHKCNAGCFPFPLLFLDRNYPLAESLFPSFLSHFSCSLCPLGVGVTSACTGPTASSLQCSIALPTRCHGWTPASNQAPQSCWLPLNFTSGSEQRSSLSSAAAQTQQEHPGHLPAQAHHRGCYQDVPWNNSVRWEVAEHYSKQQNQKAVTN